MSKPEASYKPTHFDFVVDFAPGRYNSGLRTRKAFKEGETMAHLTGITPSHKAYTSVQCGPGPDDHFELNSDLVYINHSCEPNTAFDLSSSDPSRWHLRALRNIERGEKRINLRIFPTPLIQTLSQSHSFIPARSGTWLSHLTAVANDQTIQGARYLSRKDLARRGWINLHIMRLVESRDSQLNPVRSKSKL